MKISILVVFLLATIITSSCGNELANEGNQACTKTFPMFCFKLACDQKCKREWDPKSSGKCKSAFVCLCTRC
ncbi:hypothetical protein Hanom_Chr08g00727301 [Helianthus anomalus]